MEKNEENLILEEIDKQIGLIEEYFTRHIPISADLEYIALRIHLLAEYYLNHLLILNLGSEEFDDIENLSFFDKVEKLRNLNLKYLKKWVISALLKLNKIRNNLSHSLEYKISEADVDSLGFYFGNKYIYRKFSSIKKDLKTNFLWISKALINELCRPILVAVVSESAKKIKTQTPSQTETPQFDILK